MVIEKLKQPCNNVTLMGVVRGALDFFGSDVSTPTGLKKDMRRLWFISDSSIITP